MAMNLKNDIKKLGYKASPSLVEQVSKKIKEYKEDNIEYSSELLEEILNQPSFKKTIQENDLKITNTNKLSECVYAYSSELRKSYGQENANELCIRITADSAKEVIEKAKDLLVDLECEHGILTDAQVVKSLDTTDAVLKFNPPNEIDFNALKKLLPGIQEKYFKEMLKAPIQEKYKFIKIVNG